MNRSSTKPA